MAKIVYTVSSNNLKDVDHLAYSSAERDFAKRYLRYDSNIKIVEKQTNFLGKTTSILIKDDSKDMKRKIGF